MESLVARKVVRRGTQSVAGRRGGRRYLGRLLVLSGLFVIAGSMGGSGVAMAAETTRGPVTITRDGAVVDGQVIEGYVHIEANNVTIRNSTFRGSGSYVIRVVDGYFGTIVESSKIYCEGGRTEGIVFGNYVARQVEIFGCRTGFVYRDSSSVTIVDSTWNGGLVAVGGKAGAAGAPPAGAAARSVGRGDAETASPAPAAAGGDRPGPNNTGVPAGTKLRPSGPLKILRNGQVISGLDISGCVTVKAKNVVIRKSRITCSGPYSIKTTGAKNLLVEDVEIDGKGRNGAAVCCSDYTLRRVEIHNVIDGPRLSDNTTVEQSWVHHLTRVGSSHNDALQTTGASNIVIRGNSLEAYNPVISDPLNACLMLGSTTGPIVSNLVFENNYCNGGNYSIGIRTDLRAENVRIQNNTYGHNYRFGVVARPAHPGIIWAKPTNIWVDNRKPVLR